MDIKITLTVPFYTNIVDHFSDAFDKRREIFYNETYTYAKDRISNLSSTRVIKKTTARVITHGTPFFRHWTMISSRDENSIFSR